MLGLSSKTMRKSATQRKYGMTTRQIRKANHRKNCLMLERRGVYTEDLDEFEALTMLANLIAKEVKHGKDC